MFLMGDIWEGIMMVWFTALYFQEGIKIVRKKSFDLPREVGEMNLPCASPIFVVVHCKLFIRHLLPFPMTKIYKGDVPIH